MDDCSYVMESFYPNYGGLLLMCFFRSVDVVNECITVNFIPKVHSHPSLLRKFGFGVTPSLPTIHTFHQSLEEMH